MKRRWHLRWDGTIGECTAQQGNCPYGKDFHFDDYDELLKKREEMFESEMNMKLDFMKSVKGVAGQKIVGEILDQILFSLQVETRDNEESIPENYADNLLERIIDGSTAIYLLPSEEQEELVKSFGLQELIEDVASKNNGYLPISRSTLLNLSRAAEARIASSAYHDIILPSLAESTSKQSGLNLAKSRISGIKWACNREAEKQAELRKLQEEKPKPIVSTIYMEVLDQSEIILQSANVYAYNYDGYISPNAIDDMEEEATKSEWKRRTPKEAEDALFEYGFKNAMEIVSSPYFNKLQVHAGVINDIVDRVHRQEAYKFFSDVVDVSIGGRYTYDGNGPDAEYIPISVDELTFLVEGHKDRLGIDLEV